MYLKDILDELVELISKKRYFRLNLVIFFIIIFGFNQANSLSENNFYPSLRYGGTLIDITNVDAQTINPVVSSDSTSTKIENFIFQSLITYESCPNNV